jgi:hypothetical protein
LIVVECDEPAVGDGDAMGVAAEIGQHLCGAAEGPLGVNNPVDASHGVEVGTIGREAATRNDAMDVGIMHQHLSQGVKDGDAADRTAEPAWIGGERRHRLGGSLGQDGLDDGLVLETIAAIGSGSVKTTWK